MIRHREMYSACAGLVLAGLTASCMDSAEPASDDQRDQGDAELANAARSDDAFALTTEGLIRGTTTQTTREFRGIPYAAAPVGELRWKPPQRAARHAGILDATKLASHCPQVAGFFGVASDTEDCLFLNVFAPRFSLGLKPVMVWIHGGAHVSGESDDYGATRLVDQGDVIVVTINYRLGALGFLAHPALTAESPDHASGNYGLMDQQEALRWVQRNALLFGGDPFRVTIFGESAGGLSVHSQLASPGSKGLFSRAIVESGAYALTQPTLATAEAGGTAFATAAGCTDQTAACLRKLTVAQVLARQGGASPTVDGLFLTQSVGAAFTSGEFNRVPVIEGANHDEWRLFVGLTDLGTGPTSAAAYPFVIAATLGIPLAAVPAFTAQYPLAGFASPDLALGALGSDGIFDCNARFAEQKLSQFVPTFAYEFNDPNAPERFVPPVTFPYAAAHASEIQYIFDLPVSVPAPALNADQTRLADAMVSYWTTFAHTGQPNSFHTPQWTKFSTAGDNDQALVVPRPTPDTGFAADHKCAFWDAIRR
jgi:para-nitrobenzyl esterase